MHRWVIYTLACFAAANVAAYLIGSSLFPQHVAAVSQCYSSIFFDMNTSKLFQRLSVLLVCLLIEMWILGWTNCALRALLKGSTSARHDLVIGFMNLCGFSIIFLLFFTAGLIPVLPRDTRRMIGADWMGSSNNIVLQFLIWFVLQDFMLYWFHRGLHTFSFAWEIHKYHHAATSFTMLTATRTHFLEHVLGHVFVTLPLVMLGMKGESFLVITILADALSRFRHSMVNWNFGWVGTWLLCSPVAHRIHHSSRIEHCDRNYGDTLIVWDRLFGTRYNGTLINKKVGVSNNYFEREGVIGGVLLCAAFSIRQFFKSVWTNSWRLSTDYQRKTRGDEGESRTVDASNQQTCRAA